jgi:hypothetical protein
MMVSVMVLGAEVRAIRGSEAYSLLLLVDGGEGIGISTRIHSVNEDRDALQAYLSERSKKFGEVMLTPSHSLKRLQRRRFKPEDACNGVVRGWHMNFSPKFGVQAFVAMEIATQWGPSNVPVLVDELEMSALDIFEGETEEERRRACTRETIETLAEVYPLRSVYPLRVGYHGQHVLDLPPTADSAVSDVAGGGGSQLPEITSW